MENNQSKRISLVMFRSEQSTDSVQSLWKYQIIPQKNTYFKKFYIWHEAQKTFNGLFFFFLNRKNTHS